MKRNTCWRLAGVAGLAVSASANAQFAFDGAIAGTFVDISGTGSLVITGDDASGPVTVSAAAANAAFVAGTLGACTNGHVGYGTDIEYFNGALPDATFYGGATAAAVYWDDLITQAGPNAGVYSQELVINGVSVLIIQWNNMDHYASSPSTGTFELKIYGGGTGSTGTGPGGCFAQYVYQDVDFGDPVNFNNGISATIGYQVNGTTATQFSFNTASVTSGSTVSLVADVTGACCMNDGTCSNLFTSQCTAAGGVFHGGGTVCATTTCPQPGACCLPNLTCIAVPQGVCTGQGGTFRGVGTTCATASCPFGACCATDGSCTIQIPAACTSAGGIYRGDSSVCATANCPLPPGTWIEVGDAGDFFETCNITAGSGALTQIRGHLDDDDTDMYAIQLCDPANFSATTVGPPTTAPYVYDTQLFLFDANGLGVTVDDDDPQGTGGLRSRLSNAFTSSLSPGLFYLAVSQYNKDPVDSSAQYIWQNTPFNVERAPDGPGAANPLSSWDTGSTGGGGGDYIITLTGSCYAQQTASCYANCDHSTTQPCLNVLDFTCFLNAFAAASSYANCDNSTTPPILNVLDFTCFLNKFAAGCSGC
jgi:hypothetical protein